MVSFLKSNAMIGLLLSLIFMMNIGGYVASEMMMQNGSMHNCPFMGITAVCQMSPFEHIAAWQNMFTATAGESIFTLLLIFMSAVIFFAYSISNRSRPEIRAPLRYRPPNLFFFRSPLQEALSNGILNPKLF